MKMIAALMVFALAGCSRVEHHGESAAPVGNGYWQANGGTVVRIYDREEGVICYVSDGYQSGGISCIRKNYGNVE
jgi:hypothetical protein